MDTRTIFSKTGKGSLEISKKSIKLAGDERQVLIIVDGKSHVGELEEKLSRISPIRLRAILERLAELDLIREFVTKQGPDSIMPSLGGPTAMKVEELDELDFTALAPAMSGNAAKDIEDRRLAAESAEADAAQARAADAQRAAETAARQRQEDEARRQREELEARQRAEAEARDRVRREEEAAIRAKADAEARAKIEAEARVRAEEEARRRAEEDARRRAADEEAREARRKADEEARRREEADRRQREEAERKQREEAERRQREEAERRQREETERKQREEADRREREEAERRQRAEAEARDRARREEESRRAAIAEEKRKREAEEEEARQREEAERREQEESERRERRRREEEAKRAAILEEKRKREAQEEEERREEQRRREQEQSRAPRSQADTDRRATEEAERYTAELNSQIGEISDLDFNKPTGGVESLDLKPLAGGGPDTFADTGMTANSIFQADLDDGGRAKLEAEKDARRELEAEAKDRAKLEAKSKKDAEKEAKRLAKESKVKVKVRRGGGGGGGGFSLGKFIGIFIVVAIAAGIGYLYFMPVDKALIESMATARLGVQVKVGTAKFEPFPPQLKLTDVRVDDINLPRVTAIPDPGSLAADHKIWNSIDIAGATIDAKQAMRLVEIGLTEPPKGVAMTIQRVRVTGLNITGLAATVPPMDATVLINETVKQATFTLPDNKGQLQLVPDEKGWLLEFESRGINWGLGPKTAWESLRAKGVAKADGIRFESIALTHFGGTATGSGDVFWTSGWKFSGSMDIGGMETSSIAQAYYGASPVSGTMDGKFRVSMSAPSLNGLVESTQMEGAILVNKPIVTNIDLARTGPAGAVTPGVTRFSDFAAELALTGPRVQVKNIRANSGLLSVTGNVDVSGEKALSGTLNIELGIASNRVKSALRVSGTPADPKMSK